jgi:hypothetical protein
MLFLKNIMHKKYITSGESNSSSNGSNRSFQPGLNQNLINSHSEVGVICKCKEGICRHKGDVRI